MRTIFAVATVLSLGVLTLAATDPIIGTRKLNVAESKFSPGPAPQDVTTTYSQDGDWISIKTEGTDSSGQPFARTNRFKMDGQEYPFDGPHGKGMISVKKVNDHTANAVMKFDGGNSVTTHSVISKDGKTRTMTSKGKNLKGQKVNSVVVWERQ